MPDRLARARKRWLGRLVTQRAFHVPYAPLTARVARVRGSPGRVLLVFHGDPYRREWPARFWRIVNPNREKL